MNERESAGVFFCRINGYTQEIGRFIRTYYAAAVKCGVIIQGRLRNPDEKNLAYYHEIMGPAFQLNTAFIGIAKMAAADERLSEGKCSVKPV